MRGCLTRRNQRNRPSQPVTEEGRGPGGRRWTSLAFHDRRTCQDLVWTRQRCQRGWGRCLIWECPGSGASAGPMATGPLGRVDGVDDGWAQGCDQGDRSPVPGGGPGRQEGDPGRVVRADGLASRPRPRGVTRGVEGQERAAQEGPGTTYGEDVIAALRKCWAVMGAASGTRMPRSWANSSPCCAPSGAGPRRRDRRAVVSDVGRLTTHVRGDLRNRAGRVRRR